MKRAFSQGLGTVVSRYVSLLSTAGVVLLIASASSPAVPGYAWAAPPSYLLPISPQPIPDVDGGSKTGRIGGAILESERPRPTAVPLSIPAAFIDGIPATVLAAYQHAASVTGVYSPACHLQMSLLAAIGKVETGHARGGWVDRHGTTLAPIIGPALNGQGFALVADTDDGRLDGDTVWDHAVGPMQFIPLAWARWAVDGNADGQASPHNVFDASLAAANYLCADNRDLGTPEGLRAAVLAYNHSDSYVDLVLAWMAAYTGRVAAIPDVGRKPSAEFSGPVDAIAHAAQPPALPIQTQPALSQEAGNSPPPAPDTAPTHGTSDNPSPAPPADVPASPPIEESPASLLVALEPAAAEATPEQVCSLLDPSTTLVQPAPEQCPCLASLLTSDPAEQVAVTQFAPHVEDPAGGCDGLNLQIVLPDEVRDRPGALTEHIILVGRKTLTAGASPEPPSRR